MTGGQVHARTGFCAVADMAETKAAVQPQAMLVLGEPALTLRSLTLHIYGAPILDVSRSHTTTQHSR